MILITPKKNDVPVISEVIDTLPKNGIFLFNLFSSEKCEEIKKCINEICTIDESEIIPRTNVKCLTLRDIDIFNNVPRHLQEYVRTKFNDLALTMVLKYGLPCYNLSMAQFRKIYGPTELHWDGTKQPVRSMAIVVALNDDYEGGEFVFPLQDYKIKLKKGQALVFPPYWTHPHRTEDLKNGTFRYTIKNWFFEHPNF